MEIKMILLLLLAPQVLGRTVRVGLTAQGWRDSISAPVYEAIEFLAEEMDNNSDLMWRFIDLFKPGSESATALAASTSHSDAREVAGTAVRQLGLSTSSERFLEASLLLRSYLPTLEMQYGQADASAGSCVGDVWAVVLPFGSVACSAEELTGVVMGCKGEEDGSAGSGVCMLYDDQIVQDFVHEFDHVYPAPHEGFSDETVKVIVYGHLGTSSFYELHQKALQLLNERTIQQYIFRPAPPPAAEITTPYLQGYGIFLDIKNMEYKNLDESSGSDSNANKEITFEEGEEVAGVVLSTLLKRRPDLKNELHTLRTTLLEQSSDSHEELKVWNMKDLGIQATQSIVTSEDPLKRFEEISQNLPMHASALSRLKTSDVLREEITYNMQVSTLKRSMEASLYVNGRHIDCGLGSFNFFQVLEAVREENKRLSALISLGIEPSQVPGILAQGSIKQDAQNFRIDVRLNAKGALIFLNNLERDKEYRQWPKQLDMLFYPSWQPHRLRFNLYTLIALIDPLNPNDLEAADALIMFHQHQFPVRIAVVLAGKKELQDLRRGDSVCEDMSTDLESPAESCQITSLFLFAQKELGLLASMNFLYRLSKMAKTENVSPFRVKNIIAAFGDGMRSTMGGWQKKTSEAKAMELLKDIHIDKLETARSMALYILGKGLKTGMSLFNGIPSTDMDIRTSVMQHIGMEQNRIAQMVMDGHLDKKSNFLERILKHTGAKERWHPMVTQEAENVVYAPLHRPDIVALTTGTFTYIHHPGDLPDEPATMTFHVLLDLSSQEGIQLLRESLKYLYKTRSQHTRIAFIHSGENLLPGLAKVFSGLQALSTQDRSLAIQLMDEVAVHLKDQDHNTSWQGLSEQDLATIVEGWDVQDSLKSIVHEAWKGAQSDEELANVALEMREKVFKVPARTSAVFGNGRKVEVTEEVPFAAEDFEILEGFQKHQANLIWDYLNEIKVAMNAEMLSDIIMRIGGFLAFYWGGDVFDVNNELIDTMKSESYVSVTADNDGANSSEMEALVTLTGVVDPLSKGAQRLASFLVFARDQLGLPIRLVFAPNVQVSELPLKNFYRFALSMHGSEPHAKFQSLPRQHILTMRMDTPEIWNVQASKAAQDMDNLRCDSLLCGDDGTTTTRVEYNLKNMIVVGQCFDWVEKSPPNGLQLVLNRARDGSPFSDTLVMKNLGYYQLKAQPGVFHLDLAEGRARELYHTVEKDTLQPLNKVPVVVRDFQTRMNFLAVKKHPGMEQISLLDEISMDGSEASTGYWSSVTSFFGPSSDKDKNKNKDDTIHIFSLATGHLYERMLKIMMLSVFKRTSMKVKFWLFENFLSPTFKDAALAMAENYGFEVDYVTYKWPEWLHQQSEKQRIIWGYKILFLDVLFPLDVKKVIYVDADQVVRADLKELWEMDIKGRPYAYTPFCSSRKETLGYQFWRSGFWKDHLRDMPYHISALYVVDLQAFRKMMVGDQLRGIYDNLSRDPNSLANLDQDLPNYAQHQIPIFSLPQEWLWCESWCSDSSKARAKTIDLCNNPQHKEPKLDMAKRIISGTLFKESWVELDEEVKSIENAMKVKDPLEEISSQYEAIPV